MFTPVLERPEAPAPARIPAPADPVAPAGRAGRRSTRPARRRRRGIAPYLYLLPALAMLLLWTYWPLAQTFELSVYDWNLLPTSPREFVGLENFVEVVTLPEMQRAVGNTVLYTVAFAVFSLVLPLIIALLSQHVRGRWKTFYQALIFVPYLLTPVATAAVWRWLFAPNGGTIPTVMSYFGADIGNVFRDPSMALWAIVVMVGWQMLGFGVLVVSAGMAGISPEYAQAAGLDGAGPLTVIRRITLPLLSPTLVFLGLMTVLLAAQWTYPMIDVLTKGGPSNSTTNIYYILYQFGFQNFDSGLSSAAGVLFFLVFGAIAMIYLRLTEKFSFYDD
ncbi:glycerol-3-phosphate ABC transporter permease [Microbacterium nanhaiense]|uniref:Glycerol-3-phosphate ABC transporter permease n=1 Tax=Microbacterium nanhaiense TaxID=1301026 RepID=A0ABQ2N4L9_9MICO|nr:sugar ABC transporter permease [Microbacterium nanhaiense]GGO66109.1 glycerol-3-phosphate ABC transporter permease [Microbacterium nanhaiense]